MFTARISTSFYHSTESLQLDSTRCSNQIQLITNIDKNILATYLKSIDKKANHDTDLKKITKPPDCIAMMR